MRKLGKPPGFAKPYTATDVLRDTALMKERYKQKCDLHAINYGLLPRTSWQYEDDCATPDSQPYGKGIAETLLDAGVVTKVHSSYPQFNTPLETPVITQDKRNAIAMKALGSLYLFSGEIEPGQVEHAICENLGSVGYSEDEISFSEYTAIRVVLHRLLNALGK